MVCIQTGVDFTNILHKTFKCVDPKSVIKTDCSFTLLGSGHVKAVHKMLVKLTPGGDPIGLPCTVSSSIFMYFSISDIGHKKCFV